MATVEIPITKLPPAPVPHRGLQFDEHLCKASFRRMPVSARHIGGEIETTGLSFNDYASMTTMSRNLGAYRRLDAPEWAFNDTQLRALLVRYLEHRAGFRGPQPGTEKERLDRAIETLKNSRAKRIVVLDRLSCEYVALKRRADLTPEDVRRKRVLEIEIEGIDSALVANVSIAARVIGVVSAYYRRGLSSVETGAELGMKPPATRMMLWRLNRIWEEMQGPPKPKRIRARIKGFTRVRCSVRGSGLVHPPIAKDGPRATGARRLSPQNCPKTFDIELAARMWADGAPKKAICDAVGVKTFKTVREGLRQAGRYTPRPSGRRVKLSALSIAIARAEGKLLREIAIEFGVGIGAVEESALRARSAGIEINSYEAYLDCCARAAHQPVPRKRWDAARILMHFKQQRPLVEAALHQVGLLAL